MSWITIALAALLSHTALAHEQPFGPATIKRVKVGAVRHPSNAQSGEVPTLIAFTTFQVRHINGDTGQSVREHEYPICAEATGAEATQIVSIAIAALTSGKQVRWVLGFVPNATPQAQAFNNCIVSLSIE